MMITRTMKAYIYNHYKEEGTGDKRTVKFVELTKLTHAKPDELVNEYGPGHIFTLQSVHDVTYALPLDDYLKYAKPIKVDGQKIEEKKEGK